MMGKGKVQGIWALVRETTFDGGWGSVSILVPFLAAAKITLLFFSHKIVLKLPLESVSNSFIKKPRISHTKKGTTVSLLTASTSDVYYKHTCDYTHTHTHKHTSDLH